LYYFHNAGQPIIYGGSADIMVRSFDRRIESLFLMINDRVIRQAIHILDFNLRDNVNAYLMQEDGSYIKCPAAQEGLTERFNIQEKFFEPKIEDLNVSLF
jgi:polyphosphate kinase